MSVTICWKPTSAKSNHFRGGTSTTLDVLNKAFGPRIGPEDIKALRALSIATSNEFYDEVAEKIEDVGEIEIWGEW